MWHFSYFCSIFRFVVLIRASHWSSSKDSVQKSIFLAKITRIRNTHANTTFFLKKQVFSRMFSARGYNFFFHVELNLTDKYRNTKNIYYYYYYYLLQKQSWAWKCFMISGPVSGLVSVVIYFSMQFYNGVLYWASFQICWNITDNPVRLWLTVYY